MPLVRIYLERLFHDPCLKDAVVHELHDLLVADECASLDTASSILWGKLSLDEVKKKLMKIECPKIKQLLPEYLSRMPHLLLQNFIEKEENKIPGLGAPTDWSTFLLLEYSFIEIFKKENHKIPLEYVMQELLEQETLELFDCDLIVEYVNGRDESGGSYTQLARRFPTFIKRSRRALEKKRKRLH